ncbi:MAG: hypothetical protein JXA74_07390 [Anaerolineae bacterium]|nr:hypothetical protein [Anaerolineae bacterium]
MYVTEPSQQIEVLDSVEVLVCGAGVSGCAAAARMDVLPRHLEVSQLQRELLAQGVYLGDETRLLELGLS